MNKNRLKSAIFCILIIIIGIVTFCACMPQKTYKEKITLPDSKISLGYFDITSSAGSLDGSKKYCIQNNKKQEFKDLLLSSPYFLCESSSGKISLSPKRFSYQIYEDTYTIWLTSEGDIWVCQFFTDSIIHIAKAQNSLLISDTLVCEVNCGLFACDEVPKEIGIPYKTRWSWAQIKQFVEKNSTINEQDKSFTIDCYVNETQLDFIENCVPAKTYLIYDEQNSTLTVSEKYFFEA